jgi:hypothetical protein
LAVTAASWPVIESTTNRVSTGLTAACSALISAIIASSMAEAAGGIDDQHVGESLARVGDRGLDDGLRLLRRIGREEQRADLPASVCNCSIAAGR